MTVKRRTVIRAVRLTRNERAAILVAAKRAGVGASDFMRGRLLAGLEVAGSDPPDPRQLVLKLPRKASPR
jgi:hypothetical protein